MDLDATVRPLIEERGLELVEAGFLRENGRRVFRVIVDREGGVDLDAIAGVSEALSRQLDDQPSISGGYTLEVSSPGVERPLRSPRDFSRKVGERVKVKVRQPVDGSRVFEGNILSAGSREVTVFTERGAMSFRYDDIVSARTVFDWSERR